MLTGKRQNKTRQKGVKRRNRQKAEEEEEERNEKEGIRTRQGFGELKLIRCLICKEVIYYSKI